MTQVTTEAKVEKSIRIDADIDPVWEAWADPDRLASWFVDRAEGRLAQGESYIWEWVDFGLKVEYEVTAVEYQKSFSLRTTSADGRLEVLTVRFESDGGRSVVSLVQSGFGEGADERDEEVRGVDSGWTLALELLREYVEEHTGKESQTLWLSREADFNDGTLYQLYRTQSGLESWLTEKGGIPAGKGAPVNLKLRDGRKITGSVLAHHDRETAVRWEEVDGVLELKAGGGEGGWVGLRLTAWPDAPEAEGEESGEKKGPDPAEEFEKIEETLSAALDRLMERLGED